MKYMCKNILIIIIFGLPLDLFSQQALQLDKSDVKVDPTLSQEMQIRISATVQKAVIDYSSYCTLFEKKDKIVNSTSVNRFISLFDASYAMMCKDYLFESISTQYDINDYFIDVMNGPMSTTGVQVDILNPVLTKMYRDESANDQIISKVIITKVFKNYLQDGNTGYYLTPKSKVMLLTFKTPAYYTQEALITSVEYFSPEKLSILVPSEIHEAPVVTNAYKAQNCTLIDGSSVFPNDINVDTLAMIESLICGALDKYRTTASLIDSTTGSVTGNSTSKFQRLFSSGSSLHLSDYREYPENIEVANYREDVFKFFRNTGINFELTNPRIKSISYDPDGFYYVVVKATKEVPEYLEDETYELKKSNRKRSFELEFTYLIVERTMGEPLIEKAISTSIVKPEERKSVISFGPNVSSGLVSGTQLTGYEYITDHTALGSTLGLGFQVDLIFNSLTKHRASKKPLFLAVGLSLQTFTLEAEATNLLDTSIISTNDHDPKGIQLQGKQFREISSLKDQIPIKLIGLPLGIEYRVTKTKNNKLELFLGGKIVPTYLLKSHSSFDTKGFYNLNYEQFGFSFYNANKQFQLKPGERDRIDNAYGIGTFDINNNKGPDLDSKFLFVYKLEGSMLLRLSTNCILNARISYEGYLRDIIIPLGNPPSFPLDKKPRPDQIIVRNTLFHDYYSSIKVNTFSLCLGLAYRLN